MISSDSTCNFSGNDKVVGKSEDESRTRSGEEGTPIGFDSKVFVSGLDTIKNSAGRGREGTGNTLKSKNLK